MPKTPLRALLLLLAAAVPGAASAQVYPAIPVDGVPVDTPGCGLVSSAARPIPESMDLFPGTIMRIDNDGINAVRETYRLQPGKHVLVVAENIPAYRLGSAKQVQIQKMKRRRSFGEIYKPLILDVRADRLYRIGVHLRRDRLDPESIRNNEYWHPVVWEEIPQACR